MKNLNFKKIAAVVGLVAMLAKLLLDLVQQLQGNEHWENLFNDDNKPKQRFYQQNENHHE